MVLPLHAAERQQLWVPLERSLGKKPLDTASYGNARRAKGGTVNCPAFTLAGVMNAAYRDHAPSDRNLMMKLWLASP